MTRKNVLVFRELPPDQLDRLKELHDVTVANPRSAARRDAFFAALPAAQGLIDLEAERDGRHGLHLFAN